MRSEKRSIAVIGAGSWGTALALLLGRKGHSINLWDFDPDHIACLERDRQNKKYLPGIDFPKSIKPYSDLKETVVGSRHILMVVPSHGYRSVFQNLIKHLEPDAAIISATKGVENDTLQTMSQVMEETVRQNDLDKIDIGVLSGPSFAKEVANKVPTAVTIGCRNKDRAEELQHLFNTDYFRVYRSNDLIGLEISAALKNIIAIAAGICDGLEFGLNARAALITRGLAEISRLGIKLGADPATFYGLSGVGDLVLTCTGDLSRNRTVGLNLGKGLSLQQILDEMAMVAEGVKTTRSVYQLARKEDVEMPILEQVYQILYEDKDCRAAVSDLLSRALKQE